MTWLATTLVILPFLTAAACLLIGVRVAAPLLIGTSVVSAAAAVSLARLLTMSGEPVRLELGGWGAPLGIEMRIDGLAVLMVLLTTVVGLAVSIYAPRSWAPHAAGRAASGDERVQLARFAFFWLCALGALNGLYLSADLFNIYVFLEVLGVASVALIALHTTAPALRAGLRYLLAAFVGSLSWLLGVALLYAANGTLDLYALQDSGSVGAAAVGVMTAGLLLKTGVFPVHFWLPAAHARAGTSVSPLLSGLVVKASIYLIARLWLHAAPDSVSTAAAQSLAALGAAGIVWGSVRALQQERLKLLIAYSTVAQLGYLLLVLPLADDVLTGVGPWQADAYNGAGTYMVAHGMAKAAMFMAAGCLLVSAGTDRIADLGSAASALPMTAFAFGISAVSLIGLPPSGGFVGKWFLLHGALDAGQWWWAVVVVLGSLLTVAYLAPVLRTFFWQPIDVPATHPSSGTALGSQLEHVPRSMQLATLGLALCSLFVGIAPAALIDLLAIGSPFAGGVP